MSDPFPHLHVASGYSLQYGASHPHQLVERAADHEMDLLALTDRNGTYGAIKFVLAARRAGITPILGVDLAYRGLDAVDAPSRGSRGRRQPARGGAYRDLSLAQGGLPRAVFLAHAGASGRAGWAALCRLISHTHLAGERGEPVVDLTDPVVTDLLASGSLVLLLGPDSCLARAVGRRNPRDAQQRVDALLEVMPRSHLVLEAVSHLRSRSEPRGTTGPAGLAPGSTAHAAAMVALAEQAGLSSVLTNAVRYVDRRDAPTVDVLDASRRLVALDHRHLDRANAEGHLKSGKQMLEVAEDVCGGVLGGDAARRLLARTRSVAERCALDPATDLGVGEVHFPEFEVSVADPDQRASAIRVSESRAGGALGAPADVLLRQRCEAAIGHRYGDHPRQRIWKRLDDELELIRGLGYASYFLAVGEVTDLIRELGIRCAARGSGAGSLVNYLLGVSGVEPLRHGLLMERFLSPLRRALPDIDLDVESDRRLEVYQAISERYGPERCLSVSMMETYRVRHAIRDVGAALGMPPTEIDTIAKRFPHIRARDVRNALTELPELRNAGLGEGHLDQLFTLTERLDGLPRHIAMHPCGVLLSDAELLTRTPVEMSAAGFAMSQFDKDDVEELGLLKLDVLGIRMQSAMAHAVAEIERTEGVHVDLDDPEQVPLEDPETYRLISSARTLGIFQIESPGQRELVGKSGIDDFAEIIADISLFRPGPVNSDMITPYLESKQGWKSARYAHPDLRPILEGTHGVVVFHEQVIELISQLTGCTFAEADDKRRAMGSNDLVAEVGEWFIPRALARGYPEPVVQQVWSVVEAFAAFGFCKAHAAAFALPTFQSAWLKTHWPAHFLSGVLTHDPGMYPKRLILDDARQFGIPILGLDVNASMGHYSVEELDSADPVPFDRLRAAPEALEGRRAYGIRLALNEVKGITEAEIDRILAARPFTSLSDLWQRAPVSRPIAERLVLAGAFDGVRGRLTRRDLLLGVAELERVDRVSRRSAGQAVHSVQLGLDLGDAPEQQAPTGLPELTEPERIASELEILGIDATGHVLAEYAGFLDSLGVVRSRDLLSRRSKASILVAGVKVATQSPPIRSGRRVVFLTLDDSTGPVDATFFEDVQGPFSATVFNHWLLVVSGELRRTGPRGVSLRATGAWDLLDLHDRWRGARGGVTERAESVLAHIDASLEQHRSDRAHGDTAGPRRVLKHSSGFVMSPYSDIAPAGDSVREGGRKLEVARKLWHRSPGSPG